MRRLLLLALVLGTAAGARPPSVERALERRAEADAQVTAILGGGNLLTAVARLHYLGEEAYAAAALERRLDTPDTDVRRNLAQALAQLSVPGAEPALRQLAGDDDGPVRMSAVEGLGQIHSRAARVIEPLLADPTLGVRREAARALGAMHDPTLGPSLMRAAHREDALDARAAMLIAVGESGDRRQVRELERFLRASSDSTRLAAAQALCRLGAPGGFSVARGLLASKDPLDRRHGIELFQGSPARRSSSVLRPLLADPDPHVEALAARTLYDGGDATMIDWLVLSSARAQGEARFPYEDQLDQLQVASERRAAILHRAGLK